ncbi:ATP-grasp fold amidoligase family protein [Vibrio sp. A1-1]|uniref:ATP-grasp fold amidoligase family protein n=1 Tax=Vibrio sp. A1-1 TaxID=2912250 RepID=UPI001F21A46B|nr:ATP-grasp fold amidoligase family protein [Vibrio sp. A1-1]MCF7455157.1 hypothetical protein [Vibrio sp. A1-1]
MVKKIIKRILQKTLPSKAFDYLCFIVIFKRYPSSSSPLIFNEKVFLRKYNDKNFMYTKCSDKYLVREYIKDKIGEQYLVKLISCYEKVPNITEIKSLDKFVAKSNHGAGMVEIFHSKPSDERINYLIEKFNLWISTDYDIGSNETQYKGIEKKILIEESLCIDGKVPKDYKFHCFNQLDGSVKYVLQVVDGRFGVESRGYFLNTLDNCFFSHGAGKHNIETEDVDALKKIIKLNEILMSDFNYVRIDWYVSNGRPYFGELTFTPGGGLSNEFGLELETIMCKYWVK